MAVLTTQYRTKPKADIMTGGLRTIDELTSHLYEGLIFKESGANFSIADTGEDNIVIKTPVEPSLIEIIGVQLDGIGNPWTVQLFENPTLTPGAPASGQFKNMFRSSSKVTGAIIYDAPTVTVDGTRLDSGVFGGSSGQGNQSGGLGGGNFFFGWCLKPDSYYNIRIVNNTGVLASIGIDIIIKETTLPTGDVY